MSMNLQILLTMKDQLSGAAGRAGEAMTKLEARFKSLRNASEKMGDLGRNMAIGGGVMLAASGATAKAFADLEQANARLGNAMGTIHGMNPLMGQLKSQIIDMGNRLPGNTEAFTKLAESMLSAGMPAEVLAAGALKGAGALKVMFDLSPEEAGRQFVSMGNAMGIAGKDSMAFADTIQRLKIAGNLPLGEISTAIPYMGEKLKALKIQGLEASKELLSVMGALKLQGIEGSMIGTTFEQFLTRTAMINPRERFATGGLRGDSFNILQSAGIKLRFFDQGGEFVGLYQAISELGKLGGLAQNKRLQVMQQLFGETGARMAAVDLSKVREVAERMLIQEDITKRLDRVTRTLSGRWEAMTGTFTNLLATLGERLSPALGSLLDKANSAITMVQEWAAVNPRLTGALMGTWTALALLLTTGGGVLWVGAKIVGLVAQAAPAIAGLGKLLGPLVLRFTAVAKAVWAAGAAFMATPAGWITAAIVVIIGAVYLLWKNWDRIASWFKTNMPQTYAVFKSAWDGMKAALTQFWAAVKPIITELWQTLKAAWGQLVAAMQPLIPVFARLWEAIKPLAAPWLKTLAAVVLAPIALMFGVMTGGIWLAIKAFTLFVKGWAWGIQIGGKLLSFLMGLGSLGFKAGAGLLEAFAKGIASAANKPLDAIRAVVAKIRRFLPFSPAKEGPLSDIHKLRFMETIADSIRPQALLSKMQSTMGAARGVLSRGLAAGTATGMMAAGGVSITIQNLNIDARGAASGVQVDVRRAVLATIPELKRELDRYNLSQARRKF